MEYLWDDIYCYGMIKKIYGKMIIYLLYHITIMINIIIIYYHHISIISSHNNISIITIYHIYSHLPMKTIHHRGIPTTHAFPKCFASFAMRLRPPELEPRRPLGAANRPGNEKNEVLEFTRGNHGTYDVYISVR